MAEVIFETRNLQKQYWKWNQKKHAVGRCHALGGLDMEVYRGDIYGFVGENGAGKTTLMRILTGLTAPTEGTISLFGESRESRLCRQREQIGALIDGPAFYPGMTARDNLEVYRRQHGIAGTACVEEMLRLVGLSDAADKKAKDFSLGMKQRLGIALALLGRQEFLVLDEPLNGLDPKAIAGFRKLLLRLHQERGITILISSHLLGELSQVATRYGFIHKGRMVEQISAEQLKETGDADLEEHYMRITEQG